MAPFSARDRLGRELLTDGTWEEILRVADEYAGRLAISTVTLAERGKWPAVQLGFSRATNDIVTIFDADATVSIHDLARIYDAYVEFAGDFVTGNRMALEMEPGAMRPLNWLGNYTFALLFRYLLGIRVGDALCGTKLFARCDWTRIQTWIESFATSNPFGDFSLMFAAAELGFGIAEVPLPYAARRYGATNIHGFRDGLRLAWMVVRARASGLRPSATKF